MNSESIAELIKASKASILVALGPHPKLDIWEKALEVRKKIPSLQLIRVSPSNESSQKDIIDFNSALKFSQMIILFSVKLMVVKRYQHTFILVARLLFQN